MKKWWTFTRRYVLRYLCINILISFRQTTVGNIAWTIFSTLVSTQSKATNYLELKKELKKVLRRCGENIFGAASSRLCLLCLIGHSLGEATPILIQHISHQANHSYNEPVISRLRINSLLQPRFSLNESFFFLVESNATIIATDFHSFQVSNITDE